MSDWDIISQTEPDDPWRINRGGGGLITAHKPLSLADQATATSLAPAGPARATGVFGRGGMISRAFTNNAPENPWDIVQTDDPWSIVEPKEADFPTTMLGELSAAPEERTPLPKPITEQFIPSTTVDPMALLQPNLTMEEAKSLGLAGDTRVQPLTEIGRSAGLALAAPGLGFGGPVSKPFLWDTKTAQYLKNLVKYKDVTKNIPADDILQALRLDPSASKEAVDFISKLSNEERISAFKAGRQGKGAEFMVKEPRFGGAKTTITPNVPRGTKPPAFGELATTRPQPSKFGLPDAEIAKLQQLRSGMTETAPGWDVISPTPAAPAAPAGTPVTDPALIAKLESKATPAPQPPVNKSYDQFYNQAIKKMEQEAAGQNILDHLDEIGKTPQVVVSEFWKETYPGLHDTVKARFHKYIQSEAGGIKPGDVLWITREGNRIAAKSWEDIYPASELPTNIDHLEGSQRGLISLMEIANMRRESGPKAESSENFGAIEPFQLQPQQPESAPPVTPQQTQSEMFKGSETMQVGKKPIIGEEPNEFFKPLTTEEQIDLPIAEKTNLPLEERAALLEKAGYKSAANKLRLGPDPTKDSLTTYIRKSGGLNYQAEHMKGELARLGQKESGTSGLIKKNNTGHTLDRMLEKLREDGYFGEEARPSDLLNAIESETKGTKFFSSQKIYSEAELTQLHAGPDLSKFPGLESGRNIKQGIQSLLLPSAKSPEHLRAAVTVGAELGRMHRAQEVASTVLDPADEAFTKMGVYKEENLEGNTGIQFMSDMSQGRPLAAEFAPIAEKIKGLFQQRLDALEAAGVPLQTVRENYFPGIWKDKTKAEAFLSKRPFEGGESFRKQKVYGDIMEGISAGLEPVSNNPIDLVKLKLSEMDRSIMANMVMNKFKETGDVQFVKLGQKNPTGMVRINDKYGTVYSRSENGELILRGHYVATQPVSDILNNYLSSGLYNNRYFGDAYRGYMSVGNFLNQSQLGGLSMFHAGFTSGEVQVSAGANIVKDLYGVARGNRSIGDLGKTLIKYPTAMIGTAVRGDAILGEWRNPGSGSEKIQQIAKAAELAGMSFKLERGLRTEQAHKMVQDWYAGNKAKAAFRSPVAFTELAARPIMDFLVPRQKAGVFGELAGRIIEQNPSVPLEKLAPQFRQAGNRVDARLGQVVYDRLFINNAAKNVIQGLVRAPGWTGGTIAEIGGGFKDTVNFVLEWQRTGTAPKDIPDRVAYTISLLTTMAIANGTLTYLFTGEPPQGMDYWAFRDGGTDTEGRPTRWLLPSYAKDMFAYSRNAGKTLLAKTHPLLNMLSDVFIRNKDYYGVQIQDKEAPLQERTKDIATYAIKQFVPFWVRGAQKNIESQGLSAETAAPLVGIMPASSEYTKSKAERMVSDILTERNAGQPGISKEKAEQNALKRGVKEGARRGDAFTDTITKGAEGGLNKKQILEAGKKGLMTPLQNGLAHLTLSEAIKVYNVATPEEKKQVKPFLIKKLPTIENLPPKERVRVIKQMNLILKEK